MKSIKAKMLIGILTVSITAIWFSRCTPSKPVIVNGSYFPQDAVDSFPLTRDVFKTWFAADTITSNGAVLPANSLTFSPQSNSDFYKWSAQMFLWITSPAGPGTVMESPVFYTVTPKQDGSRFLVPHVPGAPLRATSSLSLRGPGALLVARDGREFYLADAKLAVLNKKGREVSIGNIVSNKDGKHSFRDEKGNEIEKPTPIFKHGRSHKNLVAEFKSDGKSFFIDSAGNEIDLEEGQATGDGLISKNGSLLYYIIMVNDVYVQMLKGVADNKLGGNRFPTTQGDIDNIINYVKSKGFAVPQDTIALAMELKTSWVTAESLGADSSGYIRVSAFVPVYDTTSDTLWTVKSDSSKLTRLALVGMHVVGSVKDHPEMIWATFEHKDNAPNAAYPYLDVNGNVKSVPQDIGDNWLLSSNASDSMPNVSHITVNGETLKANSPFTISASNTLRINPFGSFTIVNPNPEDSPASSNSKAIALNSSLQKMLVAADVRRNYYLIGATWTGGQAPNGNSYLGTPNDSLAVGTSQLANSTMETYVLPVNYANANNSFGLDMSCFACHSNNSLKPADLSHVFGDLLTGLTPTTGQRQPEK